MGRHLVKLSGAKLSETVLTNKSAWARHPMRDNGVYVTRTPSDTFSFSDLSGRLWQKRRKLATSTLLRMCTSQLVNDIIGEAFEHTLFPKLIEFCNNGQVWYPRTLLSYTSFNTMFHANFGRSIDIDDPLYVEL